MPATTLTPTFETRSAILQRQSQNRRVCISDHTSTIEHRFARHPCIPSHAPASRRRPDAPRLQTQPHPDHPRTTPCATLAHRISSKLLSAPQRVTPRSRSQDKQSSNSQRRHACNSNLPPANIGRFRCHPCNSALSPTIEERPYASPLQPRPHADQPNCR